MKLDLTPIDSIHETPDEITIDTNTARSLSELAALLEAVSRPSQFESVPVPECDEQE